MPTRKKKNEAARRKSATKRSRSAGARVHGGSKSEVDATAIHEAGHAVMHIALPQATVTNVGSGGQCPQEFNMPWLRPEAAVATFPVFDAK